VKINIIKGPSLDKNIQHSYQFLLDLYRKEKGIQNDSNLREGIDRGAIKGIQRRGTD
jgi:hypothetical protein